MALGESQIPHEHKSEKQDFESSLEQKNENTGPQRRTWKVQPFDPRSAPEDFSMLLFGPRRAGKSTLLKYWCYCWQDRFDKVVVMSTTNFTGFFNEFVNPKCCFEEYNPEVLHNMLNFQRNTPADKRMRILLILDDVLDQERELRTSGPLKTMFTMGRHFKMSVAVCSQYVKSIPTPWRRNCDIVAVFFSRSGDMLHIFHQELFADLTYRQFVHLLQDVSHDHGCLIVKPCLNSRCFDDVYQQARAQQHGQFVMGDLTKKEQEAQAEEEDD